MKTVQPKATMKKLLTNIAAVFTLLLLNIFGLALHTSALPMGSHEMSGMNHEVGNSATCATLCGTAVFTKDEVTVKVDDEENGEPSAPYFTLLKTYPPDDVAAKDRIYAANVKQPPKIPLYILYGVFRV